MIQTIHVKTAKKFSWNYQRLGDAAYIRAQVKKLCMQLGFSKFSTDEILLALTEMLTNVTKYADNKAKVHVEPWYLNNNIIGIEIIVTDSGPGIQNLEEAMKDGYTTTRSLGLGLGAIKRLSDELEIYSWTKDNLKSYGGKDRFHVFLQQQQKRGTSIIFRRRLGTRRRLSPGDSRWWPSYPRHPKKLVILGKSRPRKGSIHNGDGMYWNEQKDSAIIAIFDGLGHGMNAKRATERAIEVIRKRWDLPLTTLMKVLHHQLRTTNGCQVMLVRVNKIDNTCTYLGVGNIRGYLIKRNRIKSLLTKDGITGKILPTLAETTINFAAPSLIILHTDGISREWLPDARKMNLFRFKASDIASDMIALHHKAIDDGTVVVIQNVEY